MGDDGCRPCVVVGQGHGDLRVADVLHSAVHHGDGAKALGAGLIDAILDGQTHGNAGGGGEVVGVHGAQYPPALLLGLLDGPVDGGGGVDGAGGLEHDGLDLAVRVQLQGVALCAPGGGMLGDGIDVGKPLGYGALGGQLRLSRGGGEDRGDKHQGGQSQSGGPAAQGGSSISHGVSFSLNGEKTAEDPAEPDWSSYYSRVWAEGQWKKVETL